MNALKKIKSFKTSPKLRIFLGLLFLSFLYWFFTSLSETYVYETRFFINYTNTPNGLLFQDKPLDQIEAQIEANGFEILSHKIKKKSISIDVSHYKHHKGYSYYYEINKFKHVFQKQFSKLNLIHFNNDSLFLSLGKLKTKKIPVLSQVEFTYKPGFKLTQNIQISPDSIIVKGPEKYIDSIQNISTIPKSIKNIYQNISIEILLDLKENRSDVVSFETDKINIYGEVAKFTQGTIELIIIPPVFPKEYAIELFPKKASLTYEVSFDQYQEINPSSFELSFLIPKDNESDTKALDLILIKKPEFIKNYTIQPKQVKFLKRQLKI